MFRINYKRLSYIILYASMSAFIATGVHKATAAEANKQETAVTQSHETIIASLDSIPGSLECDLTGDGLEDMVKIDSSNTEVRINIYKNGKDKKIGFLYTHYDENGEEKKIESSDITLMKPYEFLEAVIKKQPHLKNPDLLITVGRKVKDGYTDVVTVLLRYAEERDRFTIDDKHY